MPAAVPLHCTTSQDHFTTEMCILSGLTYCKRANNCTEDWQNEGSSLQADRFDFWKTGEICPEKSGLSEIKPVFLHVVVHSHKQGFIVIIHLFRYCINYIFYYLLN